MRSLSMLMASGIAALALTTACVGSASNTVRYNKRSANACPVEKKSTSKSKDKDSEKDAWSDTYDLQANGEDLWTGVKTVLTAKCVACHAGYDTYDTAKAKIDVYIERMSRTAGAVGFMPQAGVKVDTELALLQSWKDAGTPQSGGDGDDGISDDDDSGDDDGEADDSDDDSDVDSDDDGDDDDGKSEDC